MWQLDYKERWVPKNWCFWTVVLEKTLESPLDCKEIQPVHPEGDQCWVFIGGTDAEAVKLQHFGHLMWRTDSLEKTLMLGKIEGGRRRGRQRMRWLMASPTEWTCVWTDSRRWWWTARPGVLQPMGSQRVGHDWATELSWCVLLHHHALGGSVLCAPPSPCTWWLGPVWLETPWTATRETPLAMGLSRQEYWRGWSFLSSEILPNPGIKPESPPSQADSFTIWDQRSPNNMYTSCMNTMDPGKLSNLLKWVKLISRTIFTKDNWECSELRLGTWKRRKAIHMRWKIKHMVNKCLLGHRDKQQTPHLWALPSAAHIWPTFFADLWW